MIKWRPLLETRDFNVRFETPDGQVHAVRDVDLQIHRGEILGVVGESGCGKTQLFLAVLGLIASNGRAEGHVEFDGGDLTALTDIEMNDVRGKGISMIFQDPASSLNPYLKIGAQLDEVMTTHGGTPRAEARRQSIDMLQRLGLQDASDCYRRFPHELSGGMRQRVMIAMAALAAPKLIIADEATTALDVTVQSQILELLRDLNESIGITICIITHDLGVVAETCTRVAVMYAGRIVESGSVEQIFYESRHPYTLGLLKSVPRLDEISGTEHAAIPGQPPDLRAPDTGCAFAPRCSHCMPRCRNEMPKLRTLAGGQALACHLGQS